MNNSEIILTEKCGTLGRLTLYSKDAGNNKVVSSSHTGTFSATALARVQDLFREIFLPHGYPDSVSEDYLEYQVWDTVQAFCSTITGTFTTQAILKSVGVGNAQATPFAAALTWVMKDGTGMVGRIVFAWLKGNGLDADCKKWRLCADIVNDAAMFLELLVPYINVFSLQILCITTAMKAVVGVAGGATRASITQHQAIQGNMADVSAKDSSQETCVNLIASIVGIILLAVVTDGRYEWGVFIIFTFIHLLANYLAVCSLNFPHLNTSRLVHVLQTYLQYDTVPNPMHVNKKEAVVIGFGLSVKDLCGFRVKVGNPLKRITSVLNPSELDELITIYKDFNYLLIPDISKKVIYVALEKGESAKEIIAAYFHAVLLGIVICYYNQVNVNSSTKRHLRQATPVVRVQSALQSYSKNTTKKEEQLPIEILKAFNDLVKNEVTMFFTALKINGWEINRHSIEVGEWRAQWKNKEDFITGYSRAANNHNKIE